MKKINVEVEGSELLIQSKEGHYAVIPAKHRQEVMDMVTEGCDDCINSYIQTLPRDSDYAPDGSLLPDWDKIKAVLNPKNWGVPDYTDKGSRGAAYSAARKAGEKEFIWNNKRFNTDYEGTPQQQLKETGITNEQLQGKSELRDRMYKNLTPIDYNISRVYNTIIKNEKEGDRQYAKENIKDLEDIYRLYLGKPQINNSYKISIHKPTISKDDNITYYSFSNINADKAFDNYNNWDSKYGDPDLITSFQLDKPFNNLVTRSNTFTLGEDTRGSYVSYYDKWDMNPLNLKLFNKEITTDVGRPIELYDRIYYKDYETGRKQMYYSDKELSELDINKKNFDTLALQRELNNRGYKLPKSTKEDGTFDGIWGDETKNALLDYQIKNKTKPKDSDYAEDDSLIPDDKKKFTFDYKPYTAVQDNTYVAPKGTIPLELKGKQQFNPREQPVLRADTRTERERKIDQEYTESVSNPSISTQIGEAFQLPLRWIADPIKGVGDIVSAIAPNSALAKDLPNTDGDIFEYRKKQLNPYTSNKGKINNTINEVIPLTNWALLNTLPIEAVGGNMIKSGKNLIKPASKVVNKVDDVVKQASKQLPSSNVVNISENQNFLTDLFKPKSKKTNSNFNFDKIPERKFTTLDDFKTNYKSEYNVENPSRTFYGKKLNIEGEESNFLTRSIDDKIEKHYNNEIIFQKFKDYGGDESSYQKLIDNINTPSKTVSSGVDMGLLTDEGVSLAIHNKYLDPAQTRSTLFHEKAHQSKVVASKREDSLLPKLWDDINELTGYTKNYTDADRGSLGMYLNSPTEVYSRIMELKYKAGLKPYEKFTKELLEKTGEVVRDSNGKIIRTSGIMPPNYSKNMDKWLNLINKAPVIIPPAIGIGTAIQSQQNKTN